MTTLDAMPITFPRASIMGPPLFPGWMEVSTWIISLKLRRTCPPVTLTVTVLVWVRFPRGNPRAITGESRGMFNGDDHRSSGRGTRPLGTDWIFRNAKSSFKGDWISRQVSVGGTATPAMVRYGSNAVL